MKDWLQARARSSPDTLALIIGDNQWSYAELNDLANLAAARLLPLIMPGQHVAALLPNGLAYVCLIHALARIGSVLVPLNSRLTQPELTWQLDHSDCVLLVTAEEFLHLAPQSYSRNQRLLMARDLLGTTGQTGALPFTEFILDNPQAIIFTSGTTGKPKGVVLSFANHFWSATASAFRLGLQVDDRWLSCLPLYHVGGLAVILRSCLYGTTVVLHDRFDEELISASLDQQDITLISLVPTMVKRLLDHRHSRPWPSSLRHLLLGGAAATAELFARCQALNIPVSTTYGLTEASSQVATLPYPASLEKPGSVGKPLLFTTVAIIDDQGQEVDPGTIAEICIGGPTIMARYYKDYQTSELTLRGDRLHTGDMGYLDTDGDLWLVQRRDDIIISGGENIYPSEVEATLMQHPAVAAICVVGLPDSHWGQCVAAMVKPERNISLDHEDLLAFGRERLAGYKLPRFVIIADSLPLTSSGKIHRRLVVDKLTTLYEHRK